MKKKVSTELRMPTDYCLGKPGFPEVITMYFALFNMQEEVKSPKL